MKPEIYILDYLKDNGMEGIGDEAQASICVSSRTLHVSVDREMLYEDGSVPGYRTLSLPEGGQANVTRHGSQT